MTSLSIRRYDPSDRADVRRICADTALYGEPVDRFIYDPDLVVDGLLRYYTDFEPESLFVAVAEGRVIGYLVGCVDTKRYERIFRYRIVPSLALKLIFRGDVLRPWLWKVLAALVKAGVNRAQFLKNIIQIYPAHCHMNMDPRHRREGVGARLCATFLDYLRDCGVKGVHISSATEVGKRFFSKMVFTLLAKFPAPPLAGIAPGEIWLMGKRLDAGEHGSMDEKRAGR
ncbi:MAG: GNAT family N-acetyltransferase [Candidatus Aureabacteria bacterium]|nr:GNAT family N-acetyltransferase [Candidatus Auribacterota bacterium]